MTKPVITLYTKTPCTGCDATKRKFALEGVSEDDYEKVDITEDPNVLEALRALGFGSAPVVAVRPPGGSKDDEIWWSAYRPDLIEQHIKPHFAA